MSKVPVGDEVEVRGIKIGSKFLYENELPPIYELRINEMVRISDTKLAHQADRRKDEPIPIRKYLLTTHSSQRFTLTISPFQPEPAALYALCVFHTSPTPLSTFPNFLSMKVVTLTPETGSHLL